MNSKISLLVAAVVLQSGCATLSGTSDTSKERNDFIDVAAFPDWFQQAMKRESDDETTSVLDIHYYNINTPVKGEITLLYEDERLLNYAIDFGADAPAECYVIYEHSGLSNTLNKLTDVQIATVAENNQKDLVNRLTWALNVGMVTDTPYLSLDTLLTLEADGERVLGMVKSRAAQTNDSLQACFHNSVGYRDSFDAVFESFVSAFTDGETSPEFFENIVTLSLADRTIGYAREKYTLDADGDIAGTKDTALLIPVDPGNLMSSDSKVLSWDRTDGTLINQFNTSVDNGELSSRYLIQNDGAQWQVEGELQKKPIAATLDYQGPLVSDYGHYLKYVDLLNSEAPELSVYGWVAEADPTSAMEIRLEKADAADHNMVMYAGPLTVNFIANEDGTSETGSLTQGPVVFSYQKIYQKGEPQLP